MPSSNIATSSSTRFGYQHRVGAWLALLHWDQPGLAVINEPNGAGEDIEVRCIPADSGAPTTLEVQVKNTADELTPEALADILAHFGAGQSDSSLLQRLTGGNSVLIVTSSTASTDLHRLRRQGGVPLPCNAPSRLRLKDADAVLQALRNHTVGGSRQSLQAPRQAHLDGLLQSLDAKTLKPHLTRLVIWDAQASDAVDDACRRLLYRQGVPDERAEATLADMATALEKAPRHDILPALRDIVERARQGRWSAGHVIPPQTHDALLEILRRDNILHITGPSGSGKTEAARALLDALASEHGFAARIAFSASQATTFLGSNDRRQVVLLEAPLAQGETSADLAAVVTLAGPDRRLILAEETPVPLPGLTDHPLPPWRPDYLTTLWASLKPDATTDAAHAAVTAFIGTGAMRWPGEVALLARRVETLPHAPTDQDIRQALRNGALEETLHKVQHGRPEHLRRPLNRLAGIEFQDDAELVRTRLAPVLRTRLHDALDAIIQAAAESQSAVAEALADVLDDTEHLGDAANLLAVFRRACLHHGKDAAADRLDALLETRARPQAPPLARSEVEGIFGTASGALLGWPQETDGQWIERPELAALEEAVASDDFGVTALLGPPGAGKSALLARLGQRLSQDSEVVLLAIKADVLPKSIENLDDLDRHIAAPRPLAEALRDLARRHRVVLLVDQLDALGNLMDQHGGRLSALLGLIGAVRGARNLQVIVSCRAFEFDHDPRLKGLNPHPVTLTIPPWEAVLPLLEAHDLPAAAWPEETREVLRTPQHLALFLDTLRQYGTPAFTSYVTMLDTLLDRIEDEHGPRTVEAAEAIAGHMARDEELTVPARRLGAYRTEIRSLKALGLVIETEPGRLGFRHQTLGDHLNARAFSGQAESLARFVVDKDQSLFVRPTVRHTLDYLRDADRAAYHQALAKLWAVAGLRDHLRWLLIGLLGRHAEPTDQEAALLVPLLREDTDLRKRVLRDTAGSPGWFHRLLPDLPTQMRREKEQASDVTRLLAQALKFEPESVANLVATNWSGHQGYEVHIYQVLTDATRWTPRIIDLLAQACIAGDLRNSRWIWRKISKDAPDLTPAFLARLLWAELAAADAEQPESVPPPPDDDGERLAWLIAHGDTDTRRFQKLLDHRSDYHDLDKVAERAPQAFLDALWPWLLAVLSRLDEGDEGLLNQYNSHHGLSFGDDDFGPGGDTFFPAFLEAVRGYARTDAAGFLSFAATHGGNDLMAVQRVLAAGYAVIADDHPQTVLDFLLEDPRRLAIGAPMGDVHQDSRTLISATAPRLPTADRARLEEEILKWPKYKACRLDDDVKVRQKRLLWARERRLHLLRAVPADCLAEAARRRLLEEERAFPHAEPPGVRYTGFYTVGAPVPAGKLTRMPDEAILQLFEHLHDGTGSTRPGRTSRGPDGGGSTQQSQEFAEFAKKEPWRAVGIIERFTVEKSERPAAYALTELQKAGIPADRLVTLVRDLQEKGFRSRDFRRCAAEALSAAAKPLDGLNDDTCSMLETWLDDWLPSNATVKSLEAGQGAKGASVLWQPGGLSFLPDGNFPILNALCAGYLHRRPIDADGLLAVLRRHRQTRREDPAVWRHLSYRLTPFAHSGAAEWRPFLLDLFDDHDHPLHGRQGTILVADILGTINDPDLDHILDGWTTGPWEQGAQAAAEVAALRFCRAPEDAVAQARVQRYLNDEAVPDDVRAGRRLGLAHTFAQAWAESSLRQLATDHLLPLIEAADDAVSRAIHDIFRLTDPLPADDATRRILSALLDRQDMLICTDPMFLIDRLADLIRAGTLHDLAVSVATALVQHKGAEIGNIGSRWGASSDDLAELAMTLHRMPATRAQALDLFEALMRIDGYGMNTALQSLDRRPM